LSSRLLPDTLSGCLEVLERRHPKTIDLGLDRCSEVWRRMGAPKPAPRIFIVAGTNGKGSVVATLCAVLSALGYRHGSYTSPHILQYNERVRVNGRDATDEELLKAFEQVENARDAVSLTYFEFGTLAAIALLAQAKLDYAVMEVGLGGRLDAVNLLDADCAVITPVGLDHQEYLGNDRESIGREKAGIIRPGRPVICGEINPPRSVVAKARQLGAPLKRLGREFTIEPSANGCQLSSGDMLLDLPLPALDGPHQLGNMATAVMALLELIPEAAGDTQALAGGLRAVSIRGRFERLASAPALWVDVGHNPMAAKALAATLREAVSNGNLRKCLCVIGMLADKDAEGVAAELMPVIDTWYCAGLDGERGQSGTTLERRLKSASPDLHTRVFDQVASALESALSDAAPEDGVLVFGSFVTATRALEAWRSRNRGN